MICPRCNNVVEDGSPFCSYCGMSLKDVQLNATPVQETVKEEAPVLSENVTPVCEEKPAPEVAAVETPVAPEVTPAPEAPKFAQPAAPEAKPAKKILNFKVISIVLGALLIAAIIISACMLSAKNTEIDELNVKVSEAEASRRVAENDLMYLEEEYSASYAAIELALTEIENFARNSNCGFSSTDFYVNRGIVVLDSDNPTTTITLTTTLNNVTIYKIDSVGVDSSFGDDWNGNSVDIEIECSGSLSEGEVSIETVSFTNDINDENFDVLVICIG